MAGNWRPLGAHTAPSPGQIAEALARRVQWAVREELELDDPALQGLAKEPVVDLTVCWDAAGRSPGHGAGSVVPQDEASHHRQERGGGRRAQAAGAGESAEAGTAGTGGARRRLASCLAQEQRSGSRGE